MAHATNNQSKERKEIRNFLEKIVVDAGVGRLGQQPNFEEKTLVQVMRDLGMMTGQKPEIRRAVLTQDHLFLLFQPQGEQGNPPRQGVELPRGAAEEAGQQKSGKGDTQRSRVWAVV